MKNVAITSLIVVGLLAGYAGANTIDPGWSEDFAGWTLWPDEPSPIPGNPGDTTNDWLSITDSHIAWGTSGGYAPFSGLNAQMSHHQDATKRVGVELTTDVSSGTAILTWLSAMGDHIADPVFAPAIRVSPLHRDGPDLLQVEPDGVAIMVAEPGGGLRFYRVGDWSSTVVNGFNDTLLTNTLTMEMPGRTAQWVVKKASDNTPVYDSGVYTMPGSFDEIAGFAFGMGAGTGGADTPTYPPEYGWSNPAYDIPEPATMAVLILGGVVGLLRRRR